MGAALHLAHLPPPLKRKRAGGAGGDGHDALVTRVWQDPRQTPQSRELLLLLAWLSCRDPKRDTDRSIWDRAGDILTLDRHGHPRLADLINADRPRYEPDYAADEWQHRACAAPMIRRDGACGKAAADHELRIAPETGWLTPLWYCSRHREFGRAAKAAYREARKPEPIPNRGGLLPSYLTNNGGEAAWVSLYGWASRWCLSSWKVPAGYGIRADDWPVPGEDRPVGVPRLRLAALDGQLLDLPQS